MALKKIELRVGTIVKVDPFPKARNPSYKLQVDFGKLGVRKTSAQLPLTYPNAEVLTGKQVIAVCNFPKKNIAGYMSEFLTVGFPNFESKVRLMNTRQQNFPNGQRIGFFFGEDDPSPPEIGFSDFEEAKICCVRVNEIAQQADNVTCLTVDGGNEHGVVKIHFPKPFKNENLVGSLIVYSPKDNMPLFVEPVEGSIFLFGIDNEDEVSVGAKLY